MKTSWLKWKPDYDSAADKYMKAGMYETHLIHCIKVQGLSQMLKQKRIFDQG